MDLPTPTRAKASKRAEIILPPLHPAQYQAVQHPARFRVLDCGRRWGKTYFGANLSLACGLAGGTAWWVAPTYSISEIAWRMIRSLAVQMGSAFKIRENDRALECKNGGRIQIKTGNDPDLLRGEGLDLAVLDEAAYLSERVWTGAIRPALSDPNHEGRAVFISTPCGLNWFWRLYQLGQDPLHPDWQSWQFPSSSNPYFRADELEAARRDLPERHFREEYLAEFLDDSHGLVFRNVDAICVGEEQEPQPDVRYVAGLDWGRDNDFTALSIWNSETREEVFLGRWREIGWTFQREKVKHWLERYQVVACYAEANAMGSPNIEALQEDDLAVYPFYTTNEHKAEIIEGMALAIEKLAITLLADPVGNGELKGYELNRLPSGRFQYSAREGEHDDTVIARALANHAVGAGFFGVRWL